MRFAGTGAFRWIGRRGFRNFAEAAEEVKVGWVSDTGEAEERDTAPAGTVPGVTNRRAARSPSNDLAAIGTAILNREGPGFAFLARWG